jgi:hypothetical protein
VAPFGILLMQMPAMLRAIISDIVAEQSDMRIAGELIGQADVRVAVERTGASFIIVGHDGARLPDAIHDLFSSHPSIRVLAVTDQGGRRRCTSCGPSAFRSASSRRHGWSQRPGRPGRSSPAGRQEAGEGDAVQPARSVARGASRGPGPVR